MKIRTAKKVAKAWNVWKAANAELVEQWIQKGGVRFRSEPERPKGLLTHNNYTLLRSRARISKYSKNGTV